MRVAVARTGLAAIAVALTSSGCGADDSFAAGDASTADAHDDNPAIFVDAPAGDGAPADAGASDGDAASTCEGSANLLCNGQCVPSSVSNCGTCGNVCPGPGGGPGHAVCQPGGHCAIACDSDGGDGGVEILCSGVCVSPNDVNHCGTCPTVCKGPPSGHGSPVCPAAQCALTCAPGYHLGGVNCSSDCLANGGDPSVDPCVVADGLGTFVSPTGSDTTGDGTKEKPFGSIGHGMDATQTGRVYACGTFTAEQLVVGASRDGETVFGGFDCASWAHSGTTKTVLAPTAAGFALQVNGLTKGVTFEDFQFTAVAAPATPPASGPGASSTAVIVNASAGVVFRRSTFNAGAGQPGATGASGVNAWTGSAANGSAASGAAGGSALTCSCGGTGGQGGGAGVLDISTSQFTPGSNGQDGTPLGVLNHGTGSMTASTPCTGGSPAGTNGGPGAAGVGGAGIGSIGYPAGWSNAAVGGPGGNGAVAQGGGGGGGHYYVSGSPPSGAGGGGGCGGCGGVGAISGGTSGGSSIPLVAVASTVALDTCVLNAAAGGVGGKGGDGLGGQSAGGGGGGDGAGSCTGGPGGQGGTGGAGGGGVGGHSIAIAYSGTAPTEVGTVTKNVASTPASGGSPGGGTSNASSQGQAGLAVAEQSF